MRFNISVSGGADLSRALASLGDESTVAGRRALRSAAKELQTALIAAAPRGTGDAQSENRRRYGQLFKNIRVREARALRNNTVVMTVSSGDAFWARFLEFGTVRMKAKPWFRPVWDRMQNRLVSGIGTQLGIQIERAARRIARRGTIPNGRNG